MSLTDAATPSSTNANSSNHQNSGRDARPEKLAYLLKHVEMAWPKFM